MFFALSIRTSVLEFFSNFPLKSTYEYFSSMGYAHNARIRSGGVTKTLNIYPRVMGFRGICGFHQNFT